MHIMTQLKGDIVLSGGGLAGLTLGILLGRAGLNTHLIDIAPPPANEAPSGRTVALMENSLNIIRAAGIWDAVKDHAAPLETMRIVDDSSAMGRTQVDFHASDIGMNQFGHNIPNNVMRGALYEAAKKTKNLTLHVPDALQTYTVENGVTATLKSGKEIAASLIIGGDGRNSLVRKISAIDVSEHDYKQSAITCLIAHSRSHNNIATEFHRPGGPLALVPMPGNISSVVWIEPTERANGIMRLKKQEFTAALQIETRDILGAITLESNPECWPLKTLKAKTLTAPRAVLMAEAAHVISPITAQGLNLSLRDVAALAETLVDAARAGMDIGLPAVLNKYEKRRRVDINTRVFGVDGMNKIVSVDANAIKGLRRAVLKTLDNVQPLKNIAMKMGLAPEIDAGRLARGGKL
jgi:2-octaprenyl-6-methoxyphenol hydroxylase